MAKRTCPLCFVKAPWTAALVHSYEFECRACHAALELSRFTRIAAGLGGIVGAAVAVHLSGFIFGGDAWFMRVAIAIVSYGIISAACALLAGDLAVPAKPGPARFPHPEK